MLRDSQLLQSLQMFPFDLHGQPICIYGDPAYFLRIHLQALVHNRENFNFFQVLLLKPFHPFYKDSLKEFHNTIYPHIHDTLLKMRSRSYKSTKVRKPLCTLVRRMEIPQSDSEHCFDDKISTVGRLKGERTVKLFY